MIKIVRRPLGVVVGATGGYISVFGVLFLVAGPAKVSPHTRRAVALTAKDDRRSP